MLEAIDAAQERMTLRHYERAPTALSERIGCYMPWYGATRAHFEDVLLT